MAKLTGEVLGERTVLNFQHQADNPSGDHVAQQHIGRTDHATGYQTQLQFNLYPTLEHGHSNIVNHPPRPAPVVIERLAPHSVSTHNRLEVAALVARRDFRNGYIPAHFLYTEQSEDDSSESEASETREPVVSVQPKATQVVETVQSTVPPVLSEENHPHISSQEKDPDIDKMASEVVSLRRQLHRQVSRLREAVHVRKTSKAVVEDEDDIERELHREDGRSIRNMQSLYALKQQVQKLKSELNKHQRVSTTVSIRDTRKSLAMKQLAATHRSAIRLLYSLAGMPGRPAVYQQLSELMQQLTLCCCQLGLDGTKLLELNDQMKALESEIVELNKSEEELTTITRLRQLLKKPTRAPPPQRRPQWHRNLVSAQGNRRSGHFRAQTFSSLMRKQMPPAKPKTKHPPPQKHKHRNGPSKFTSAPPSIPLRPSAVKPVAKAKQPSVPASRKQKSKKKKKMIQKQHSKQLHSSMYKDNNTVTEVTPLQSTDEEKKDSHDISDEDSSCDSESSTEDVVSLINDKTMRNQLLSTSTPMSAAPAKPSSTHHHDNSSPMIPLVSNDDNSDGTGENLDVLQALKEMLVKISHIEEEKMRIQQRWNNVTYQDTTAFKPAVRIPTPSLCSTTTLSVSPNVLKSVSHYRDRFQHHLKLKGAITGLNWESSKLIEEISEEILDEIVDCTVNELDQLCEEYVHNVYASEFAIPNSNI